MDNRHLRLTRAMEEAGVTRQQAVERWGWNDNTLKSNMNGKAQIGPAAAKKYAAKLHVRHEWLYYGDGPMREPRKAADKPPKNIPVLSWVSAGNLLEVSVDDMSDAPIVVVAGLPDGEYIATKVRGDSMDRISPEGSTIIVRTDDRELVDGRYYLFSIRGETTYKRYYGKPMRLEPYSTNPANRTIFPDGDAGWQVVGRVYRSLIDLA